MIFTKKFWQGAGERALKTFIQTSLAAVLAVIGNETTAWDVPWLETGYDALGIGLIAAVASLATSMGNSKFVAGEGEGGTLVVEVDNDGDHGV